MTFWWTTDTEGLNDASRLKDHFLTRFIEHLGETKFIGCYLK